jgi:inosine-uridine nucleoside N-ribohydrolase
MEEGLLTATDRFLELCRAIIASSVSTELVLVTLGPLTNLATFLEADRLLCLSAISKLYIMGGCGNGRGNCSRTAEFNICADPEASSRVFEETLWRGITVVPWEVCIGHPIPWENFDALVQSPSLTKLGRFISNICQLCTAALR